MISDLAISEVEKMQKDGLSPTPADIIRLNALGLKIERCQDCGEFYTMPRVAFLGGLTFREPSLAAIKWVDQVFLYSGRDFQSQLCVWAFALSRHPDELPESLDRELCTREILSFVKKELPHFTIRQINAAVSYAINGDAQTALEYPPDDPKLKDALSDPLVSIGVGILMETVAVGLGISLREASLLTRAQAHALQEIALRRANVKRAEEMADKRSAEFYATLEEVKTRLKKEQENG